MRRDYFSMLLSLVLLAAILVIGLTGTRAAQCPRGCVTPPRGCVVKGNISDAGEKIYHTPDSPSYLVVIVSPERGELWFCSEEAARANGFRKAFFGK